MNLISCTLTGVDQQTDLHRIIDLSCRFPQAEFGILFSPERSGRQHRFPTFQSILTMLDAGPIPLGHSPVRRGGANFHSGSEFGKSGIPG